jgi:formate dehydrogenase major subunit
MTNHWVDIKHSDLILVMGGNAAEAHPCGFKWVTEAMEHRKARLVVVDPRYTRSAAVADFYAPIRVGSDIAFLGGVVNYLLTNNKIHKEYVLKYTNAPFIVGDQYAFDNGLFSGYDEGKRSYDRSSWGFEKGDDGFVKVDETLKHPRSVYQLMKKHFSRYTPEKVEEICGTPKADFLKVAEAIGSTCTPDRVMTILYALGWTQHSVGSENIRTMAMIQLLLGNMGRAGGGVNALRGHANVQGITDMCTYAANLPGYLSSPTDADTTYQQFIETRTPKEMRPGAINFWKNFSKFQTSLMKAWWGNNATKDNNFAYDYLPKRDQSYDVMHTFERMVNGEVKGLILQGFNPTAALPNKRKLDAGLAKLDFMVVIDPLKTEAAEFWKNHGEFNNVNPADIKTEVIRLPSSCFAEDEGTFTNSGRVIQWHWAAAEPPGEAKRDREIMGELFTRLRALYQKEGGRGSEPFMKLTWNYSNPKHPSAEEVLKEISGNTAADILDPATKQVAVKAGEQVAGFGQLKDDGSTSCGNWIYSGCYSEKGNLTARRDKSDPGNMGNFLNWGFAWPANRRVLYNRAGADSSGKPWDATRPGITWDGQKWSGVDVPDMVPTNQAASPFIMTTGGVGNLFAPMAEGPFPEHYEPFETPIGKNPMNTNPKAVSNPASRIFKSVAGTFGTKDKYPYAATTYRLTEHFHFWTKNVQSNAIVQPSPFVEINPELAADKGIKNGDMVKVWNDRGEIKATAVVTKRIRRLKVAGQPVDTVGIPIHFGFVGVAKNGFLANTLTPNVADANSYTPEYKAFLVNIAKV